MKKVYHNENNTITANNLQQMANAITIKALTTNLAKSGNTMIGDMLIDAIMFSKNPSKWQGGNGAELVQDTALFLWQYNGQLLTDTMQDGQTDKDGNPITILRGAFRNIRGKIHHHEKTQKKQCYIDDYESEHGVIKVPSMWDVDTYHDFTTINTIIKELELTENQKYILHKRMQGFSLQQIADTKKTSKQAVANTLAKIGNKYIAIYGDIAVPVLEKIQ